MSLVINRKQVGGLTGGGKLKVGKNAYEITGADYLVNKNDPTGKEKQVVLTFRDGDGTAKVYLAVNSQNDVQRNIAQKAIVSCADAVGFQSGDFKIPAHLPKLVGHTVVVTARETVKAGKTYVNVSTIEAYEGGDEEEEETEETEEESEEEESEEETEEAEEEPAPAPKSGAKKKPWE